MDLIETTRLALPVTRSAPIATTCWISGGAVWITASLIGVGADDGSDRFYAAEAVWIVAHLLVLAGIVCLGALRVHGDRRLGQAGFAVAFAGRVVFVAAEAVSIATGELAEVILPIGALVSAIGMTMAGTAIAREGTWRKWRRFAPLAMGVFPFVFMFPLAATGAPPDAAIAIWSVPTIAIGLAARSGTT